MAGDASSASLGSELGGDLPCVVCGYNLRGLSILGSCPECGARVRATILAVVDPHATELRPIVHPRRVAVGISVWTGAALVAAALCWAPYVLQLVAMVRGRSVASTAWGSESLAVWIAGAVVASGLGAAASLVRPHAGIPRRKERAALAALLAYVPLAWLMYFVEGGFDPAVVPPEYLSGWPHVDQARAAAKLVIAMLLVTIVLGLRPTARLLVARSLLLRSGRVDRQTLFAFAGAVAVAAMGDVLGLLSVVFGPPLADAVRFGGLALLAVGSALMTLGLVSSFIDSLRIGAAILRPAPGLHQVVGGDRSAESGRDRAR